MQISTIRQACLSTVVALAIGSIAPAELAAQTEVRIVSGQQRQNGKVLEEIFGAFNAGNPGVRVALELDNKTDIDTTQKVLADIAAGTPPDAVRVTGAVLRAYVDSGRAQPLDDCIASAPELAAQLDKTLLDAGRVNGKLYSMPWYTTLPALFYNAQAFRAAGLDPANPPKTWSELQAAAVKLTDAKANRFGILMYMPNTYVFESQLLSAGGAMLDGGGKPSVAGAEAQAVMTFMRTLVEQKAMPAIAPGSFWTQSAAMFNAGDVAMMLSSASGYPQLVGASKFEVGVAPMPVRDGGSPRVAASSNGFVLLATDPARKAATCKALLALLTPENVAKSVKASVSPAFNTLALQTPALLGDFYRQNPTLAAVNGQPSRAWYAMPGKANPEFQKVFGDIQHEILSGAVKPADGLARLSAKMAELLATP